MKYLNYRNVLYRNTTPSRNARRFLIANLEGEKNSEKKIFQTDFILLTTDG